jgi:hypothetical protein
MRVQNLPPHISTVALAFIDRRFGGAATVSGEGAANVDLGLELAFLVPADIPPVPLVRFDQSAFTGSALSLCRHFG